MLFHEVTLELGHEPRFPSRCIACENVEPDSFYVLRGKAGRWIGARKRVEVRAPACWSCCGSLRLQRWGRIGVIALFAGLGLVLAMWLSPDAGGFGRWFAKGGLFVGAFVGALIYVFFPLIFDITVHPDRVDYEFRSRSTAEEFARLNNAAVK